MEKNEGSIDRILRVVVGALLVLGAVMGYGWWMWIGVVPLLTGAVGWCPLYSVLGIRTCPMKH